MKFSNPLRRLFSRDEQLARLNSELAAAGEIPELGERMLRYADFSRSRPEKQGLRNLLSVVTVVTGFAGFVIAIGALAGYGLPFLLGGGALLVSSGFVGMTAGADTDDGFSRLRAASREATEKLIANTPLASFARSPKFGAVMARFPLLREEFVLSAARDRVLEADAPSAPLQARKETLSL